MIVLPGTFTAKPGAKAQLVTMAQALIPPSRAEEGCMRYDFLEDAITPGRFLFFELWRSREDLNAHFQQPYFKAFAQDLPVLIEGLAEIVTYETAGAFAAL